MPYVFAIALLTTSVSNKEGLTTRKNLRDKTKAITKDKVQNAIDRLDKAKEQYTWKSLLFLLFRGTLSHKLQRL